MKDENKLYETQRLNNKNQTLSNFYNLNNNKKSMIIEYKNNFNKSSDIGKKINFQKHIYSKSHNLGNLFKSILDKNSQIHLDAYINEEYSNNFDKNLNKIIGEKTDNIMLDYISPNIQSNQRYNPNFKLKKKNSFRKESPIKPIYNNDSNTNDHTLSLNRYYENLDKLKSRNRNNTLNYTKSLTIDNTLSSENQRKNKNYTLSSFNKSNPSCFNKTISTGLGLSQYNLKSLMKRINNYEKQFTDYEEEKKIISEFKLPSSHKIKKSKNIISKISIDLIKNNILDSRNDTSKTYRLKENLLEMRTRLKKDIKKLVHKSNKSNFHTTNDQILHSLEKTNNSEYTKDIIEKIKIINYFISTQPKDRFESDLIRHRKIFVIIDGTVVFNEEVIRGDFVDIPTRRYLSFLEQKKDRLDEFYKFLSRCQKKFRYRIPFQNIFLLNGINVFDLIEIPDCDNALFVSASNIFRGIFLFFDTININNVQKKDYRLLKIQECRKARATKFVKSKKEDYKNKTRKKNIFRLNTKKKKTNIKTFKKYIKKNKFLNEQSFTFGISDKNLEGEEKYYYYSDDDEKVKSNFKNFQKKYPTLISQLIHFNEEEIKINLNRAKLKNDKKINNFISKRLDENTYRGLNILMRNYNNIRAKKFKITLHQDMKPLLKEMKDEISEETKGIFKLYLKKLKILSKKVDDIELNMDLLNENKINKETKLNNLITQNIKKVDDVLYKTTFELNKYYPDLISMNIPAILKTFPKLKRNILYEIYSQFKTLLSICVCINRDLKQIKRGIDFSTFFNCLPQMRSQGYSLAYKIYKTINKLNTECLNWEDYMQGMYTMKSPDIKDKIDVFFHIIDSDGNGFLSFDEVYEISKSSLQRSLGHKIDKNDEVVNTLSTYFANLIFQLVDMPIDEEISIEKIREKILEGQDAAGYLEMFICADSFTNF